MSEPYVGEIRLFAGNYAPNGWAFCNGQILSIDQNSVLYTLIGTTYGGDGQQTFQLPDLQGRAVIHQGPGFVIGQAGGQESVTLTTQQIPSHNHLVFASSDAAETSKPSGTYFAASDVDMYSTGGPQTALDQTAVGLAGSSLPHDNMHPFVCVNYIIALFGVFPSQG